MKKKQLWFLATSLVFLIISFIITSAMYKSGIMVKTIPNSLEEYILPILILSVVIMYLFSLLASFCYTVIINLVSKKDKLSYSVVTSMYLISAIIVQLLTISYKLITNSFSSHQLVINIVGGLITNIIFVVLISTQLKLKQYQYILILIIIAIANIIIQLI
ncbi:hypothetical protein [Lactococcus garvieae]